MNPEADLIENGFTIVEDFFDASLVAMVEKDLDTRGAFDFSNAANNSTNLLTCSAAVLAVARDPRLLQFLNRTFHRMVFPVKAFILDKTVDNNWEIPWHQDLRIAVNERKEVAGYVNWSIEAGIDYVQPPVTVLDQLITVRIHVDQCKDTNGAVYVIPGSHKKGIVEQADIPFMVEHRPANLCEVNQYGVMFMKPLLLHKSPASQSPSRRRIVQIEYGTALDGGLSWHGL